MAKMQTQTQTQTDAEVNRPKIYWSSLAVCFARALAPRPPLTVAEWSDKYRMLPEASAHESGLWRTSRFPFLRRIMELLSPENNSQQIVVQKGAQLGFTELALNWMFYTIDYSPAPMLYVQKTLDNVSLFGKQRFDPSIYEMPTILRKLGGNKVRAKDRGDSNKTKMFPGGMIRFGGANSAASLRSMPIERLILDEEDSYEQDIQEEGSPSELAIRRTANFPNRKIYRLSTPTIKETSVIEPLFEGGTKERFYIPCPHCGNMDWIRWANIKWENDDPKTVRLVCEKCGVLIDESYKTWMLERGEWRGENGSATYPSFHISSLYSPIGFYSWKDACSLHIRAIRNHDNALLKTFINTVLGETWSESGTIVKASKIEERKEPYKAEVPEGCLILTMAADVQKDRIEVETVGWGRGMESWSIDYSVYRGDTERMQVWEMFHSHVMRQWVCWNGTKAFPAIVGVDCGFHTKIVYEFCKRLEHRNVFAIKGDEGWGKGYINRPTKRNKYGVWRFDAYVDEIKSKIYSYLQISEPGPGYCHYPTKEVYDKNYFKGLTSEFLEKRWVNGRYRLKWVLPQGRRNEPLDCRSLNIAALNIIAPNFDSLQITSTAGLDALSPAAKARKRRVLSNGF